MNYLGTQQLNGRKLLKFVFPSVVMMMFVSVYSMMGSVFASNFINEYALAAVSIVFPFNSLVIAISVMFAMGANAIISANFGEKNDQKANENFTVITILAVITGFVLTVLVLLFDDQILIFLGATEKTFPYAKEYLRTYSLFLPLLFIDILSHYFFPTAGKAKMGLRVVLIGGSLNIFCTYLFTAVFNFGISGIVLGMIAVYAISTTVYIVVFSKKGKSHLHFVKPKLHKGFILKTCSNGSSEMVTNLAISIVAAMMNKIMGNLVGDSGIAAVSVISQMQFLLGSMYIGFGAGIAPVFAYAYGAKDFEQTKILFRSSVKLIAISSLILVVMCLICTNVIVGAFIDYQSSTFALTKQAFILFSISFVFTGMNIFASLFFTSVSNGKISALISFLRTFIFIVGMLLLLPPIFGTTGVWLATPIAEFLGIIVSILLLIKYKKVYQY